ncbi:MAG: presenilin family intramembrane aspartyl protease [Candidatus Woesearchaeota archaeon]
MKHNLKITLILLLMFLAAQFVGIGVLYSYIDQDKSAAAGETIFEELPIGERPPLEEKTSFVPIILAILIGTALLLLLIKYQLFLLWRVWFLFAVVVALIISWGAFLPIEIALVLALVFGTWKIFKPNIFIQNFTEVFVYGGLAAIFVPLFTLLSVIILLILISAYDMYAVWKSKHMIKLAQSQAKAKIFAGLLIHYRMKKEKKQPGVKGEKRLFVLKDKQVKTAVLGGGDIGFPLIFTGVIMAEFGWQLSLVIPIFSGLALFLLLLKGKEKKFYPAMPFITAGCLIGLGVVMLLRMWVG